MRRRGCSVSGQDTLHAVNTLLCGCEGTLALGGVQGRKSSGQVEVESVNVRQTALHHDVERTVQTKTAEDAMGGAAAKDLAATENLLNLAIRDVDAIDGLFGVELILEINGGGVASPVRSAKKPALGQVTPLFRLEIIMKEPVIRFVKRRDISSIGRPARRDQSSGFRQERPLSGA